MSSTNIRRVAMTALVAFACGAIGGWFGRSAAGTAAAAGPSALARTDAPAPHTLLDPGPVITVSQDGRVTMHVDHESLQWVLTEIDRQGGARAATATAAPLEADRKTAPREEPHTTAGAAHPEEVLARLLRGTEPERYETLAQAQNGGAVSEDVLRTLYQTDASPRVRLLAFDYAQEGSEADPAARRNALAAARLLPDPVVSQEAARLLEALDRADRGAVQQASTN